MCVKFFMNIDAQDAQDLQHEKLMHRELTGEMIRSGVADARDQDTANSQNQILYILFIHVDLAGRMA